MNAIEHGNEAAARAARSRSRSLADDGRAACPDHRPAAERGPIGEAETPDLEAKLAGLQKPRGWGLFLIENMVDEHARLGRRASSHTVELVLHLEGDDGCRRVSSRRACAGSEARRRSSSRATSTAAPRRRSTPPTREATSTAARVVSSTSPASAYINSTGIALIVGLLAQGTPRPGRRSRPAA